MYILLYLIWLLFVGFSTQFLINDVIYEKKPELLWETWFNPFQTTPSNTIHLNDGTFIAFEQSTIIESLFIGTLNLKKLPNDSYVIRNIISNTKYGIIGLVYLDHNECELLDWDHYNGGCFLALKRVDYNLCNTNSKYCSLIIRARKIQDIFGGSISEEIPMQRLDVSPQTRSLYFISRNFDESKISKYQNTFRDFFNYTINSYSLTDNTITNTLESNFTDSLIYLSSPIWIKADLVPDCLTLIQYDDHGFLVANIIEYAGLKYRYTVTLGSIQTGYIIELSKTLNTPKIIVMGDTPPYEKIVIVNGMTGEIQRHDMYPL